MLPGFTGTLCGASPSTAAFGPPSQRHSSSSSSTPVQCWRAPHLPTRPSREWASSSTTSSIGAPKAPSAFHSSRPTGHFSDYLARPATLCVLIASLLHQRLERLAYQRLRVAHSPSAVRQLLASVRGSYALTRSSTGTFFLPTCKHNHISLLFSTQSPRSSPALSCSGSLAPPLSCQVVAYSNLPCAILSDCCSSSWPLAH